MSSCWKCGAVVVGGLTECGDCAEVSSHTPSEEQLEKWDKEFQRDFMEVDWSKVKTLEDVITILSTNGEAVFIQKNTPEFERLKKFLKPINE